MRAISGKATNRLFDSPVLSNWNPTVLAPAGSSAMALWPWLLLIRAASSDSPYVTAPAGQLRGIREGETDVFRGIPYAEAPIGPLRWRPPVALKPWQGVRDASSYGNFCKSLLFNSSTKGGSEDCLYLNVYRPREAKTTLPCLVWIHGGAFENGASNLYNGSSLVNHWRSQGSEGLLVTLNYRLNVFGFLGSDQLRHLDREDFSTGNYGIQDQRMALRWVQENIAAFGGDPKKVPVKKKRNGA